MSLYSMLMGENKDASVFLKGLNLKRQDFERYRDAYLNADGTKIIIYTRLGGPNREYYAEVINDLRLHESYLEDYDDEYDETYAYFVFKVPEHIAVMCKRMATGKEPLTVGQKFEEEIAKLQAGDKGALSRADKVAKKIEKGIEDNSNGGIIDL